MNANETLQPGLAPGSYWRILTTNARAHAAITSARIVRDPGTMAEVRDALNQRQNQRERTLSESERVHLNTETVKDIRSFGQVERTLTERMNPEQMGLL